MRRAFLHVRSVRAVVAVLDRAISILLAQARNTTVYHLYRMTPGTLVVETYSMEASLASNFALALAEEAVLARVLSRAVCPRRCDACSSIRGDVGAYNACPSSVVPVILVRGGRFFSC